MNAILIAVAGVTTFEIDFFNYAINVFKLICTCVCIFSILL